MNQISFEELTNDIRTIYQSDISGAETAIERYLEEKLQGIPSIKKLDFLKNLGQNVKNSHPPNFKSSREQETECMNLFSLLLGKEITAGDFSSKDLLKKLAPSLNIIFDTLNELVGVMNATLLGQRPELETIRQIIGSSLKKESPSGSLKNYLDQIKDAFLIAHRSFIQAARNKVGEILVELDPESLEAENAGSLKFGPLRKAELFDMYKIKYRKCKNWFESRHIKEEFLREFEKNCQKIYSNKGGAHEKIS